MHEEFLVFVLLLFWHVEFSSENDRGENPIGQTELPG